MLNLENRFTPVLAYIEYCGFKIDVEKWSKKMEWDNYKVKEQEELLNQWIMDKGLSKYFTKQLSLFDPVSCSMNWSAPKQVTTLFEDLGINCTIVEKGVRKKSIEAPILEPQKDKFPIIPIYLKYKGLDKVVSTYGQSFLDQVNTVSKRLHTSFNQIMDTGRISSGGTDKLLKTKNINFQNIPATPEPKDKIPGKIYERECFISDKDNVLIISDYSGQENVVLVNKSLDPSLLKFYDNGLGDMHSYVASLIYLELYGLSLADVKKYHKDKRQIAKLAAFTIVYGGNGATIASNCNITVEEGNRVYDAYMKAFPGLRDYFKKVHTQALRDGYILMSRITRRKCYIQVFDKYKELEEIVNSEGFWDKYRWAKEQSPSDFPPLKQTVSDYFYYKGMIERNAQNYPIQSESAEITKIACIYVWDYIIQNKLLGIVKIVNVVHDELVVECPKHISEDISKIVGECMGRAADIYCKRVKLSAVPEIHLFWQK